ncbi:MAG: hypothetical protein ACK4K8_15555 [Pannonibacter sp.]
MIPPITAPVEAEALARHVGEPAHGGWRDCLIAGAFKRGLRSLGIYLRLVAECLQPGDAVFQCWIGEIGNA